MVWFDGKGQKKLDGGKRRGEEELQLWAGSPSTCIPVSEPAGASVSACEVTYEPMGQAHSMALALAACSRAFPRADQVAATTVYAPIRRDGANRAAVHRSEGIFPITPGTLAVCTSTPGNAFRVSDDLDSATRHHGIRVVTVEAVKEHIVRAPLGGTNQGITNVSTPLHPIRSFARASP